LSDGPSLEICLNTEVDFSGLGLAEPLLRAISEEGYTQPTPIQQKAIPLVMAGRDLLAAAQTGTGKTAGFTLPILHALLNNPVKIPPGRPRVLVLTPTRANSRLRSKSRYARTVYIPGCDRWSFSAVSA
jgi:ATP-dependent RNA helicase RhlE